MTDSTRPVVVVADYENLCYSLRNHYGGATPDFARLLAFVEQKYGPVALACAYGDFRLLRDERDALRQLPDTWTMQVDGRLHDVVVKSATDCAISSEVAEALFRYPDTVRLVLVTGDWAVASAVLEVCRRTSTLVSVIAVSASASHQLQRAVRVDLYDRVICPLESLPPLAWGDLTAAEQEGFGEIVWQRRRRGASTTHRALAESLREVLQSVPADRAADVVTAAKQAGVLVRAPESNQWCLAELVDAAVDRRCRRSRRLVHWLRRVLGLGGRRSGDAA